MKSSKAARMQDALGTEAREQLFNSPAWGNKNHFPADGCRACHEPAPVFFLLWVC
jgi:predicted CxxxxCH...CXXCH cytochrome family protein